MGCGGGVGGCPNVCVPMGAGLGASGSRVWLLTFLPVPAVAGLACDFFLGTVTENVMCGYFHPTANPVDAWGEGCAEFDKLQVVRSFGISHVILAGVSLLALLANHTGAHGLKIAAIATSALAGTPREVVVWLWLWLWLALPCLVFRLVRFVHHPHPPPPPPLPPPNPPNPFPAFLVHLPAAVGIIAFAVFIDLKQSLEHADPTTFVKYGAGFGLFTGAWLASVVTAAAAATIKPKSLAAELGSDVKAAL